MRQYDGHEVKLIIKFFKCLDKTNIRSYKALQVLLAPVSGWSEPLFNIYAP